MFHQVVRQMVHHGLSVMAADSAGVCPIHAAADRGHAQVVALLVDNGADLAGQTLEGITPLHLAARGGHSGTAKLLISLGADANAATENGLTPLHIAVQEGFTSGDRLASCHSVVLCSLSLFLFCIRRSICWVDLFPSQYGKVCRACPGTRYASDGVAARR